MIQIDNNSSKALYEQIYEEITRLILSKALKPDEKLPSVRELAAMVKINPNTIQRAYRSLEEDNYIYTIKGKGNFVKSSEELRDTHIKIAEDRLKETIKALKNLGLNDNSIVESVKEILNLHRE